MMTDIISEMTELYRDGAGIWSGWLSC